MKQGQTKSERPLSPIDEDEPPFQLSSGWSWTRLGSIASYIQRGKSPSYADSQGVPVVSQKCVKWTGLDLSVARLITPESLDAYESVRFLRTGDLLWNSTGTGTIGRIVILRNPPPKLVCDSHVTVVRCLVVDPEYVRLWLRSDHVYGTIEVRAAGSTKQVELTSQLANNQVVPIPPLNEQHRIVSKVDELMALCDRLEATQTEREQRRDRLVTASLRQLQDEECLTRRREGTKKGKEANEDILSIFVPSRESVFLQNIPRLTTRPEHIKALRQIILNLAVRGYLVSQDANDEPASDLLKQIQAEKAQLVKKGKQQKEITLPTVGLEQAPFALPTGWSWARFPELGTFGRGKSKHRPRNDVSLYDGGTHLFIQTGDVARSHGIIQTYTKKYNEKGLEQSMKWPAGTLCITIAANIADSGILSFDACFPDSVVGFIPASMFQNARYFEYFVRTAKENLLAFAPATAQKNINLEILNAVRIPLPPLAEQHRIVAKVDELMALCDQLDANLATTQTDSRRLLEAVLRDALAPAMGKTA
jgi:type I restriction enzyme S subunit